MIASESGSDPALQERLQPRSEARSRLKALQRDLGWHAFPVGAVIESRARRSDRIERPMAGMFRS